jgi:hypothetical protein
MHPGVIIGGLSGICAALALIASIGRAIYRSVASASVNAGRIDVMTTDVDELKDTASSQGTRIAVLEALAENDDDSREARKK